MSKQASRPVSPIAAPTPPPLTVNLAAIAKDPLDWVLLTLLFCPTEFGFGRSGVLWGPPGVAKTARIRQIAEVLGIPCVVLSPGTHGEGAFGVVPVPMQFADGFRLTYPSPAWVDLFRATLEDDDGNPTGTVDLPGLVFMDELTTCPPALAPALLGLLEEHKVGDTYLGPRVRVLAAANPPKDAGAGWDLPAPVANRLAHFETPKPSAVAWNTYMTGRADAPTRGARAHKVERCKDTRLMDAVEDLIRTEWQNHYPRAIGAWGTWLARQGGEYLHKMPESGSPDASRAWPSHRANSAAVDLLTTARLIGAPPDVQDTVVAATVGATAATAWATFQQHLDLPDPAELLDGKVQFAHDPMRLDRTMAVFSSCAALVTPPDAVDRNWSSAYVG